MERMKIKIGEELIQVPRFISRKATGINRLLFNRFLSRLLQAQANKTKKAVLDDYQATVKPGFDETIKSMESIVEGITRGIGR
jgi:hypothetical protein